MKPLRLFSLSLFILGTAALTTASRAEERSSVTLYSAQWCGYCTKARAYLRDRGIAHREIDIESEQGRASFSEVGGTGKGVPLLVAGQRHVRGFSEATYDGIFAAR